MTHKLRVTETIRLLIFNFLLVFLVASQILQSKFINTSLLKPGFTVLCIVFFLHLIFNLFEEVLNNSRLAHAVSFALDAVLISILAFYLSGQLALFILMFLLNIALCGYLFAKKGALILAILTSMCFSVLVALDESLQGQRLIFAVGLNNLAFFVVASLSGSISEQLSHLGLELKKSEKGLKILKDINGLILKNIRSGFISCNEEGKVVLINDSASKILNKKMPQSTNIINVLPGISEIVLQTEPELEQSYTRVFEYQLKRDGEVKDLLFSVSDILGEKNSLIGRIYLFTDITKMKKLEKLNQRNEKLAAVGQLAAGIAHEIRNPLASMSGSLQFLQANLKITSNDDKKLMQIALREIERLDALITEFLEFVKPEESPEEDVDVVYLIESCLEQLEFNQKLKKNVEKKLDFGYHPVVKGSEAKLKQVFLNLFINAYHAMEKKDKGQLKISVFQWENKPTIRIEDTGNGMSEETKRRLFEPFHTTKAKGTGLGLATSHKILQAHGANIHVESSQGAGSQFQIEFPASSLVQVKAN